MTISCTVTIAAESTPIDPEYRSLLEKAIKVRPGKLYGLDVSSIAIMPGATLEYYVVFRTLGCRTPQKLYKVASAKKVKTI